MKKQRWEESEKRREEERRSEKRKRQRRKTQVREKVAKSRNTVFFQWFVASEGRKVGSLKRRVRSHLARWEMKNCTLLWREAHFEAKMCKTQQAWGTFGSWDIETCTPLWRVAHFQVKMYNTLFSEHFWKLTRRKRAPRGAAKHISKSKC